MKILHSLYLAVLLIGLSGSLARGQEMSADEQAVWQLEEDYWRYVKEQDMERYLALWHDRFVGWPSVSANPQGKANITDWIGPLHADPARVFDYELDKEAVRSFGDIVVTHFLAWYVFRDARTGKVLKRTPLRLTHTWLRHGNSWQIITGMSAPHTTAE